MGQDSEEVCLNVLVAFGIVEEVVLNHLRNLKSLLFLFFFSVYGIFLRGSLALTD